ncbi:MAG: glycosyltransferase family 2 protein [Candidatus Abyssobacteria bacterium SURF_5]|uniref:Glycosyltransferase family 2 protein n=1 Tax=Abyssobacteria bacterium (strain SURF_5) TaxID=2093360 RepID=A0A3A4NUF2_ABYX5|nr:MAG: glycosyltransferase family 2 protein [Candidatus Abyssubacteria bacterium SURF_5]
MTSRGKVSVIIPTYNGIKYIPACLDSLRSQSRVADEIIVVDDGSSDGTAALLAAAYPEARLVRLKNNQGFAAAANKGISSSSGDYIALLNNDTTAHKDWLKELIKVLDEQPSVSFCSSKMLFADQPDTINSIGIGFTRTGIAMDVGFRQKDGLQFERARPVFGACAGAAIFRRSLFDEIGLLDEDLFMWYEDVDFSLRARLAGRECLYVPTAIIYHKGGGTISSKQRKHIYYCARNQILIMVKNLPRPLLNKYLPRLFSVCLKHSIKSLLKGDTAAVSGYCAALKDLKPFLRKRQLTNWKNTVSDADLDRLLQMDSNNILASASGKTLGD